MNISSDFSSYEIKSEAVSSMVNVIVYMKKPEYEIIQAFFILAFKHCF